jgi:hypothetical protein
VCHFLLSHLTTYSTSYLVAISLHPIFNHWNTNTERCTCYLCTAQEILPTGTCLCNKHLPRLRNQMFSISKKPPTIFLMIAAMWQRQLLFQQWHRWAITHFVIYTNRIIQNVLFKPDFFHSKLCSEIHYYISE